MGQHSKCDGSQPQESTEPLSCHVMKQSGPMWVRNRDIIEGEARQFIEREMEPLRAGAESGEVENKAEDQGKDDWQQAEEEIREDVRKVRDHLTKRDQRVHQGQKKM